MTTILLFTFGAAAAYALRLWLKGSLPGISQPTRARVTTTLHRKTAQRRVKRGDLPTTTEELIAFLVAAILHLSVHLRGRGIIICASAWTIPINAELRREILPETLIDMVIEDVEREVLAAGVEFEPLPADLEGEGEGLFCEFVEVAAPGIEVIRFTSRNDARPSGSPLSTTVIPLRQRTRPTLLRAAESTVIASQSRKTPQTTPASEPASDAKTFTTDPDLDHNESVYLTVAGDESSQGAPLPYPLLYPTKGPNIPADAAPTIVPLTGMTLGRTASNTLQVKDPRASRQHARITYRAPGEWRIEDCGSTGGTLVNRVKVSSARLHHGSLITIGETTYRFVTNGGQHVATEAI